MTPKNLLLGIVAGVALAAGIWIALSTIKQPAPQPTTATVLPVRNALPPFLLVDQHGNAVSKETFRGQWDLVFFGFTNCPDVCPLTLQVLSAAKRQLAETGQSPLPRIVLVSVDPERDTPERMAAYVNSFGDGHLGVTGELDELRKLTDGLGIFFDKRFLDQQTYTLDHSSVVILVDPEGRFFALFSSPHEIGNFVDDLPLLMTS